METVLLAEHLKLCIHRIYLVYADLSKPSSNAFFIPSLTFCRPGPEVIKLFHAQLSIKFYMLISIKISRNSAFLGSDKSRMLFSRS